MWPLTSGSVVAINSLILIGAVVLLVGGVALITSGARLRRRAAARRVDQVQAASPGGKAVQLHRLAVAGRDVLVRVEGQNMPAQQQREAARRLVRLGVPARHVTVAYTLLRVLVALAFGGVALYLGGHVTTLAGSHALLLMVAGAFGVVGWYLPRFFLSRMVKGHAKAAAAGLPDALELLVVCVEAGLSLEDGIDRIIGELQHSQPALAEELALTSADLKILPSRDQALANLAARVDIPSVRSVVSTLSQTLRYGTPLAQAMRVVAADMRTEALINLEERANRLPAIMTVPMMLFIMPTIFLIVGGPAILTLLDIMRQRR
jgi:tight adherence protein C